MSNLIITIIAIALVALAALMSAYYGSTAWNRGRQKAQATTLINQKQQIKAAAALYKAKNNNNEGQISDLVDDNYLNNTPEFEETVWKGYGNDEASSIVAVEFPADVDSETATSVCRQAYEIETGIATPDYEIPACNSTLSENEVCCLAN